MDVLAEKVKNYPKEDISEIIMFSDDVLLLSHSDNIAQKNLNELCGMCKRSRDVMECYEIQYCLRRPRDE